MQLTLKQYWHASWQPLLTQAFATMDQHYLNHLMMHADWLPGAHQLLNAFSLPVSAVNYILLGESPYPRAVSANGYAFWDGNVTTLWSDNGFSKPVNRATSLRNFMKMLLVADQQLSSKAVSGTVIQLLDKTLFINTLPELFHRLIAKGFLLLNASLVWHDAKQVRADAKYWQPFMQSLLQQLYEINPNITLILWGNIAQQIEKIAPSGFPRLSAPHPYNISFIHHQGMQQFFAPLRLLRRDVN